MWSAFTSLPEDRAGGGLVYNSVDEELIFASGAFRPVPGNAYAVDYATTWTYDLKKLGTPDAEWKQRQDMPYAANHIRYVRFNRGDSISVVQSFDVILVLFPHVF